ncbi:UNVERIFIED_CONTAM: hypothetical protein FKN15_004508 [Acipenser sinensis]
MYKYFPTLLCKFLHNPALGTSVVNQVLGSCSVHCGPYIRFNWRDATGHIKGVVGLHEAV